MQGTLDLKVEEQKYHEELKAIKRAMWFKNEDGRNEQKQKSKYVGKGKC